MEMFYNIKKHYKFSGNEIKAMAMSILAIAFMLSFKSWGTEVFNIREGLINLISAVLIVTLGFIIHLSLQRFYAFKLGYTAEYNNFMYGIMGGLLLTFASNGNLFYLAPGHVTLKHMPRLRLGEFRYGMNMWEYAKIATAGPIGNLLLAAFFKAFTFLGNPLIERAVTINILLALFSMVPLPSTDGLDIFFGSRIFYFFVLAVVIGMSIALFLLNGIWLALGAGLFIGIIVVSIYFIFVEESLPY